MCRCIHNRLGVAVVNQFRLLLEGCVLQVYYYWHIYLPVSRKRRSAAGLRARLRVFGHLSTTLRWGNPIKCLSHWHNKRTCRLSPHCPLMLNVKQGSCEYQFYVIGLTRLGIESQIYRSRSRHSASIPLAHLISFSRSKNHRGRGK